MLTQSEKSLTKTADSVKINPSINGDALLNEDFILESTIEALLSARDIPNGICEIQNEHYGDTVENKTISTAKEVVNSLQIEPNKMRTIAEEPLVSLRPAIVAEDSVKSYRGDASKLLMNYPLLNQGKNVCDVTEIPEFILVFTAFRAKDTFIIPPNDLEPMYIQAGSKYGEEPTPLAKFKPPKNKKNGTPSREIRYVRYSPPKNVLRRERAIQVNMSPDVKTTEIGVQCDLEEEREAEKEDNSQLEWINHIIEAHVFNAESDKYECHICGEIAASYASKLKHSLVHKQSSSLCFQCGLLFTNHVKLKEHEKKAHLQSEPEIKIALRCPKLHCTQAFHSKKQLFKHIDRHTKKTEQRCSKCQRSFSSFIQLYCHKSRRKCWR